MEGTALPTPLYLPHSIQYPITIQRINKPTGAQVRKTDALFTYSFKARKTDSPGEERLVRVWESPIEGEVTKWEIKVNQVITNGSHPFVHIQEPCTHDVQLHGLCALCGKDLTATDYTGFSDTSRAAISMVHDVGGLTVSMSEASRLEAQTTARLKQTKKLSLIVDLDQTIIHATVDPTVGEWLDDPENPNFSALNNTGKFKLGDEDDTCWYYVKQRPGLQDFLTALSAKYEMHVYTMGTRAYAVQVCKLIDPEGNFFGGRILSRDESGSMTHKSLERLFPCETNMVVIIDDRADVWDGSPNLLKVIPYEFFPSVGDINSAFLPKRKELKPPPTDKDKNKPPSTSSTPAASTTSDTTATVSDLVVTPTGPESVVSPALDEAEADNQATLHDQIEDRPLSKAQAEAKSAQTPSEAPEGDSDGADEDGESDSDDEPVAAILKDDDAELDRLEDLLNYVHAEFFDNPDQGDVKSIIPQRKRQTLRGVNLVLSGLVQLGTRPQDSEYWRLATTFGANCFADLHSKVTHVVANQGGTQKVHQARRMKGVRVVKERWLVESAAYWRKLDEVHYPVEDPVVEKAAAAEEVTEGPGMVVDAAGEETDDSEMAEDEEELDLGDIGWGDANAEIDDLLNETDSEADTTAADDADITDGESANGDAERPRKKRARTATTDSESEQPPAPPAKRTSDAPPLTAGTKDSPLQKRVKHSRSRRSGLKVSLLAGQVGGGEVESDGESVGGSSRAPSPGPGVGSSPVKGGGEGGDTDGGSTVTSEDDFDDLLADIESGFS